MVSKHKIEQEYCNKTRCLDVKNKQKKDIKNEECEAFRYDFNFKAYKFKRILHVL